jgi:hypothetical protein
MKIKNKFFAVIFILAPAFFLASFTIQMTGKKEEPKTESPTSGVLYNEIAHMDTLIFDAFNSQKIDLLKLYFDPKLELYQDNIGVRNYNETMEAFTNLFKKDYVLTWKVVPGSMEVYPIKGYGAIQTGQHIFSHVEAGKEQSATYKFMQIWQKKDSVWTAKSILHPSTFDQVWKKPPATRINSHVETHTPDVHV